MESPASTRGRKHSSSRLGYGKGFEGFMVALCRFKEVKVVRAHSAMTAGRHGSAIHGHLHPVEAAAFADPQALPATLPLRAGLCSLLLLMVGSSDSISDSWPIFIKHYGLDRVGTSHIYHIIDDTESVESYHDGVSDCQFLCLAPGSPVSLARFIERRGLAPLQWERRTAVAEGLEPTEQLQGADLKRNDGT